MERSVAFAGAGGGGQPKVRGEQFLEGKSAG